jgi:RND superfamily putative drug exporter
MTKIQDSRREAPPGRRGVAHLVCGRRSKWVVLVLWLAVLFLTAPFAQKLTDAQDNDAASWLPGSAESTQVLQISENFRPEQIPAVVVYARDGGLTAGDRAAITEDVDRLRRLTDHGIRGAETRGPVFDRESDPRAAQVYVPITMDEKGWERIAPAVDSIRDVTGRGGGGLAVHITGPGGTSADFAEAFEGIDSTLLLSAMAVVIVMLLLTYRSPTLLVVPLIAVIVALFTAQALIYLLAEHAGLTVNGQSAGILTVLVFGAGTDYALLLVARYREELRRHEDRHEAMALALHRAGPAVIASGATVVLSMLVLLAAEMNSTSGLGPVAAIGVAVGLFAMLTLFPALLVVFGRWIFWPVIPHVGAENPHERGVWARMGRRIAHTPAHGLGRHGDRPDGLLPRPDPAARRGAEQRGRVHRQAGLDHRPAGLGPLLPGRQRRSAGRRQQPGTGRTGGPRGRRDTGRGPGVPRPATGCQALLRRQGALRGDHERPVRQRGREADRRTGTRRRPRRAGRRRAGGWRYGGPAGHGQGDHP